MRIYCVQESPGLPGQAGRTPSLQRTPFCGPASLDFIWIVDGDGDVDDGDGDADKYKHKHKHLDIYITRRWRDESNREIESFSCVRACARETMLFQGLGVVCLQCAPRSLPNVVL